jgi:hypothetical protein
MLRFSKMSNRHAIERDVRRTSPTDIAETGRALNDEQDFQAAFSETANRLQKSFSLHFPVWLTKPNEWIHKSSADD